VTRLVCVSNRVSLPCQAAPGGLAVGLLAALRQTGGLWFGWSGAVADREQAEPEILTHGNVRIATIDLARDELDSYYNGYCNSTLWPVFHYFPDRFTHDPEQHEGYQRVNARFAGHLTRLLRPWDAIWVHDYQLIPLGRCLRRQGFTGPIGFFLHIPFPHVQVLRVLPGYLDLVRDLCEYDVVGFQTDHDREAFLSCIDPAETRVAAGRDQLERCGRRIRLGVYPIGVDVDQVIAEATATQESMTQLTGSLHGRSLIIGVDRLDYSKGLPERFAAFEHFLEIFPENRGKVTYLQIAPLSRADVSAYGEIRQALEQAAGRTNGRLAEADWTPIRYLNRNYSHATLMGFLRAARVALVTPVRDGMNLVAKEFVAAQDPQDPGVLILSPLAGAASELTAAIQVNPHDRHGMALALQTALTMPLAERRRRHAALLAATREHDIHSWYGRFLGDLTGGHFEHARQAHAAADLVSLEAC
jgi:trehalose 6-phosphate synthase